MPAAPLPPLVIPPLTDNAELVAAIARISGEDRATIIGRLIAEERRSGANVRTETAAAGLRRYRWTPGLTEFYRTTKSFLYESAVWNRMPLKLAMRRWIGAFVRRHDLSAAKVLTFGDGLGFDAAFMAMLGCAITYYEPSEEGASFARAVFARNRLKVAIVTRETDLPRAAFDIVLCLDVLEHVPSPPEIAARFAAWLSDGGYLITHSPFFYTEPYHPTHLASNRRYSGSHRFFRSAGLYPFAGRFFWDPIVLRRSLTPQPNRLPPVPRLGGLVLKLGRVTWPVHALAARLMARPDPKWRRELESMQSALEG